MEANTQCNFSIRWTFSATEANILSNVWGSPDIPSGSTGANTPTRKQIPWTVLKEKQIPWLWWKQNFCKNKKQISHLSCNEANSTSATAIKQIQRAHPQLQIRTQQWMKILKCIQLEHCNNLSAIQTSSKPIPRRLSQLKPSPSMRNQAN